MGEKHSCVFMQENSRDGIEITFMILLKQKYL